MKLERLLGITTCLLNRKTVTARFLANRYEVSVRTIQRDIAALNTAGIPIVSLAGQNGGYGIADGFTLSRQLATPDEFRLLSLALEGLRTAWTSEPIARVQEKIVSLHDGAPENTASTPVFLDFSTFRESPAIDRHLGVLEKAIKHRRTVRFSYATDGHPARPRTVEPLALQLKWHAWYLFAWCTDRKGYRLFKLARIADEIREAGPFSREHGDVGALVSQQAQSDIRPIVTVRIQFRSTIQNAVREYLGVHAAVPVTAEAAGGSHSIRTAIEHAQYELNPSGADDFGTTRVHVPNESHPSGTDNAEWLEGAFTITEGERGWMSFLIGFGADIRVLSPQSVAERAVCIARAFLLANA